MIYYVLPVNMHFEKKYSRNIQGRNQMIYFLHAHDVLNKYIHPKIIY